MLLIVGEAMVAIQRDRCVEPPVARAPDPSGAPAISAYIAARLGVPTAFVAGIGEDESGRLMRDTLSGAGVDTGALVTSPTLPTATATVDYFADGSRTWDFRVVGSAATAVESVHLGDWPERASWLHVSGSALLFGDPLAATMVAAFERAHAAGATISVDPNIRPGLTTPAVITTLRTMFEVADIVLPSEGELDALELDDATLVRSGKIVCTTVGAGGCLLATPQGRAEIPALLSGADVVDTDGAGDTFAAAFVAASMNGADPAQAAYVATRIVARAIAVPGPMTVNLRPRDLGDTYDG